MEMQHPEVASQLDKIKEVTLAEVVEAASFQQREDREAFLERLGISPASRAGGGPGSGAAGPETELVGFLRNIVASHRSC